MLLVDTSPHKRELRSEIMRRLGMEVDCAAGINEARSWWRAGLYNLVLINVKNDVSQLDKFCEDIRVLETPPRSIPQQVRSDSQLVSSPQIVSRKTSLAQFAAHDTQDLVVLGNDLDLMAQAPAPESFWSRLFSENSICGASYSFAALELDEQARLQPEWKGTKDHRDPDRGATHAIECSKDQWRGQPDFGGGQ